MMCVKIATSRRHFGNYKRQNFPTRSRYNHYNTEHVEQPHQKADETKATSRRSLHLIGCDVLPVMEPGSSSRGV